jgi:hypothetical protein
MTRTARNIVDLILDSEDDQVAALKKQYGLAEPDYDLAAAERQADAQGFTQARAKSAARAYLDKLRARKVQEGSPPNLPIKLRLADGTVVDAMFNGYWDVFDPPRPSIGYPAGEGHSHGIIHDGDQILTPVPSPEEWAEMEREREEREKQAKAPPKASFWPSM